MVQSEANLLTSGASLPARLILAGNDVKRAGNEKGQKIYWLMTEFENNSVDVRKPTLYKVCDFNQKVHTFQYHVPLRANANLVIPPADKTTPTSGSEGSCRASGFPPKYRDMCLKIAVAFTF